ncbi:MAG TPA: GntR family transcriptional regulator [Gemmataceae bacterium]|jgi:DNA-binding GntR family transcriptional regulator
MKRNSQSATARTTVAPVWEDGAKVLLRDRAYRELKGLIQSEAIAPGAFLSERQLVERLGMSKTPIRAALHQLEAEGLVMVSPQQGILVRELTAREITELFDLRLAVEPFVVRRLAGRMKGVAASRLRDNLQAQKSAAVGTDVVAVTDLDVAFHLLFADTLENREIAHLLRRALTKLYREIVRISHNAEGRFLASYEEHAGIADAVLGSDSERAAALMENHLRFGKQFLLG